MRRPLERPRRASREAYRFFAIAFACLVVLLLVTRTRDTASGPVAAWEASIDDLASSSSSLADDDDPVASDVSTPDVENSEYAHLATSYDPNSEFSKGLHLITTFFKGTYAKERFEEILSSLENNLGNDRISKVHVLWEDEDPRDHLRYADVLGLSKAQVDEKLVTLKVERQPTYKELFEYSNSALGRGAVGIIANGDIFFDDTLRCINPPDPSSEHFDKPKRKRPYFGLTRRHASECGSDPDYAPKGPPGIMDLCDRYIGSHDAFIYAHPIPTRITEQLDHKQNEGLGAENVVIWELNHNGFRGFNPCDMVRANHLHCSGERHYSRRSSGKLVFVSGKKFNNGVRKHGWIKPWHWRKTITCPYELY